MTKLIAAAAALSLMTLPAMAQYLPYMPPVQTYTPPAYLPPPPQYVPPPQFAPPSSRAPYFPPQQGPVLVYPGSGPMLGLQHY